MIHQRQHSPGDPGTQRQGLKNTRAATIQLSPKQWHAEALAEDECDRPRFAWLP